MVKDNSDLHEPSESFSYLNPRLGADLDINDTHNKLQEKNLKNHLTKGANFFCILFKKFNTCKKKI